MGFLSEGFILEKKIGTGSPKVLEDCKVMVANCQMDTDKIKIYGAKVKVDSYEAVADIEKSEREKMKTKVDKICKHGCTSSSIDSLFTIIQSNFSKRTVSWPLSMRTSLAQSVLPLCSVLILYLHL